MKSQIRLPHNCRCSTPSVFPKNWKTKSASTKIKWRISYYFYDPNLPPPTHATVVKGMNDISDLKERQALTKSLLEDEIAALAKGYNPRLKKYFPIQPELPQSEKPEMNPDLPIIDAFRKALEKIDKTKKYIDQVGYSINRFEKSAQKLGMTEIKIGELKRSQLLVILDEMKLPNDYFNKVKVYFSSLFKKLVAYECCETNLTRDIEKRMTVKTQRKVLSPFLIDMILEKLRFKSPEFYRYANIFFFSGGRTTELFSVQMKDVRLESQEYDVLIKKGNQYKWTTKVIIQDALPFWTEIVKMCKSPDDYLFSHRLVPGPVMNCANQITRRWKTHVKDKMVIYRNQIRYKAELDALNEFDYQRINEDFYSLKHAFLDLLDEMQNAGAMQNHNDFDMAQGMGGHNTPKITHRVYTIGKTRRENERMKKLTIKKP